MSLNQLDTRLEAELFGLVRFERDKNAALGAAPRRCAFPFRPDNPLQAALVEAGVLEVVTQRRADGSLHHAVALTQDAYAHVAERERAEREARRQSRRDWALVITAAAFSLLGMLIGFLVGQMS